MRGVEAGPDAVCARVNAKNFIRCLYFKMVHYDGGCHLIGGLFRAEERLNRFLQLDKELLEKRRARTSVEDLRCETSPKRARRAFPRAAADRFRRAARVGRGAFIFFAASTCPVRFRRAARVGDGGFALESPARAFPGMAQRTEKDGKHPWFVDSLKG